MSPRHPLPRLVVALLLAGAAGAADAAQITLHSFTGAADGGAPQAALLRGRDGNLYGVTTGGGAGAGTVFRITPAGVLTTLHSFDSAKEGASPGGSLTQGKDGNFYGVTGVGGKNGYGTVYRVTPAGALTVLHHFDADSYLGGPDRGGLAQGADGAFYGIKGYGGGSYFGFIYRIDVHGAYSVIHSFGEHDSFLPLPTRPVLAADGNFYAVSQSGLFSSSAGTLYRFAPDGTVTALHHFPATGAVAGYQGLALGGDGALYGVLATTRVDNLGHNGGVLYRLSTAGVYSVVHDYTQDDDDLGRNDGGLVATSDGLLLGTDELGAYRLTTAGAKTRLYDFPADPAGSVNFKPPLSEGADGNYYGVTSRGGAYGAGSVYQITRDPVPIAITPKHDLLTDLNAKCVTAGVSDAARRPVAGAQLAVTRTGANPGSASLVTGADGSASHCWTGTNAGFDRVQIDYGNYNDTASITWLIRPSVTTSQGLVYLNPLPSPGYDLLSVLPSARITDGLTNQPVAGAKVTFYTGLVLDRKDLCSGTTDKNGVAQCLFKLGGYPTNQGFAYTVEFAGNGTYTRSQAVGRLLCLGATCPDKGL